MKIIKEGILFEEPNIFLDWGKPVQELVKKYNAIVEKHGNIYYAYWGENTFIKNSAINLMTPFINNHPFQELEFLSTGKSIEDKFDIIKEYLNRQFGQPTKGTNVFRSFTEWVVDYAIIRLDLDDFRSGILILSIKNNCS